MHFEFFNPLFFLVPVVGIFLVARVLSHFFRGVLREEPDPRTVKAPGTRVEPAAAKTTESRVFALAYRLGGRLMLSDVVMETGFGLADAESLMDQIVDELHVKMKVEENGLVIYEFPEVIDRLDRESR